MGCLLIPLINNGVRSFLRYTLGNFMERPITPFSKFAFLICSIVFTQSNGVR